MTQTYQTAIIFIDQPQLLDVVRTELKSLGVKEIHCAAGVVDCAEMIDENESSLLVLDWGVGEGIASKILAAVQGPCPLGVRPIFLISTAKKDGLDGVALEYNVSQLLNGDVSGKNVQKSLMELASKKVVPEEVLEGLASCYKIRKAGNLEAVFNTLDGLNKQYPEDVLVASELAEVCLEMDNTEEAIGILKSFVDEGTKDVRISNMYGRCMLRKGDLEKATIYLERAKLVNPSNVDRLLRLGETYLNLDDAPRAKVNFEQAIDMDPGSQAAKTGMGKTLLLAGEINEALEFLKHLSGAAEMASTFNAAAVIAIRNGRLNDGVRLYKTAVKTIGVEDTETLAKLAFNMGLGYQRGERYEEAYYYYLIAVALDSDYEKASRKCNFAKSKVKKAEDILIPDDLIRGLTADEKDIGTKGKMSVKQEKGSLVYEKEDSINMDENKAGEEENEEEDDPDKYKLV